MRAQKNHKNKKTIVHHLPKKKIDSVEVHIKNSENELNPVEVHERGNNKKE